MRIQLDTPQDALDHPCIREALVSLLYRLADDELVLGHRDSEWLGLAPEIEEDVAFSSISQDEVGHANFYYGLLSEINEGNVDALAYGRSPSVRLNGLLVERENGDWAFTIARHLFYDIFEDVRLVALLNSTYTPLRNGAHKIRREEYYHQLHFRTWFTRLIQAGGEARERMERAITALWADVPNLFHLGEYERDLLDAGILNMSSEEMYQMWFARIGQIFTEAGWAAPPPLDTGFGLTPRTTHTEALESLIKVMAEVYHLEPGAVW
jgi:ring-1,2-phenylacetyl-CoA epoxidase subunit PaaC